MPIVIATRVRGSRFWEPGNITDIIEESHEHCSQTPFNSVQRGELYQPTARYGRLRVKTNNDGGYDLGNEGFRTFGSGDGKVVKVIV